MNTIFILIMLFSKGSNGLTTVTVEFNSFESCEITRKHMYKVNESMTTSVLSHGCYKK